MGNNVLLNGNLLEFIVPSFFISTTTRSASIPSFMNPLFLRLKIRAGFSHRSLNISLKENLFLFCGLKAMAAVSRPGIPGGAFQIFFAF